MTINRFSSFSDKEIESQGPAIDIYHFPEVDKLSLVWEVKDPWNATYKYKHFITTEEAIELSEKLMKNALEVQAEAIALKESREVDLLADKVADNIARRGLLKRANKRND